MTFKINCPVLVFLGPPGSGKGTLASKTSKSFNFLHLSTGDLLRSYIQKGTPEAKELQLALSQGKLAPKELFMKIFLERIQEPDCQHGLLLDGFPRSLSQAKFLDELSCDPSALVFVHVYLSDQEVLRRLSGRRTCPNCKKVYHIEFSKPQKDNTCDDCDASLMIRDDDQKEVISHRLSLFHASHSELKRYYQNRPYWIDIDASASPDECFVNLYNQLQKQLPETFFDTTLTCT